MPTYSGDSSTSVDAAPRTQASTLAYIRQQLVKWQWLQKDVKLNALKEYEQYEVHVQANKVDIIFAPSVLCKVCNRSYTLRQKVGSYDFKLDKAHKKMHSDLQMSHGSYKNYLWLLALVRHKSAHSLPNLTQLHQLLRYPPLPLLH